MTKDPFPSTRREVLTERFAMRPTFQGKPLDHPHGPDLIQVTQPCLFAGFQLALRGNES